MEINKEKLNEKLGELNSALREELVNTEEVTISEWNDNIAPLLSKIAQVIDGSSITARTFKLPKNYFDEEESPEK